MKIESVWELNWVLKYCICILSSCLKRFTKYFHFWYVNYFSGEAKNLITNSVSGTGKNTFCIIRLDREEIYRTTVVNRSLKYVFYDIIILSKTLCFYHHEQRSRHLPLWTKHLAFTIVNKKLSFYHCEQKI